MPTIAEIKTALADYFQEKAEWRREEADRHPDDPRHDQSADAFDRLARFTSLLPEADDILTRFAMTSAFVGGRFCVVGSEGDSPESDMLVSRFGFGRDVDDAACRTLLESLLEPVVIEDRKWNVAMLKHRLAHDQQQ